MIASRLLSEGRRTGTTSLRLGKNKVFASPSKPSAQSECQEKRGQQETVVNRNELGCPQIESAEQPGRRGRKRSDRRGAIEAEPFRQRLRPIPTA